jgi:hypothetical protein
VLSLPPRIATAAPWPDGQKLLLLKKLECYSKHSVVAVINKHSFNE